MSHSKMLECGPKCKQRQARQGWGNQSINLPETSRVYSNVHNKEGTIQAHQTIHR